MTVETSAAHHIEPEPPEWATRSLTFASKVWCAATAFYFGAFLFAYFYLKSLNTNKSWTIGTHVHPSLGLGVTVMALFALSGLLLWLGSRRPVDELTTGVVAIVLALGAIALQFLEYSVLRFGPASGGYASVFFGWTATYALGGLFGVYWMETQIASLWRARRTDWRDADPVLLRTGLAACATVWTFYVGIGVLMFIVLYLV